MNKKLRMLILPFLLWYVIPQSANAQQVAISNFAMQNIRSENSSAIETPLKNVFQQIENRFSISITYKSGLIGNKKVAFDLAACTSADIALKQALAPFDLSFERVRDYFYIVILKKRSIEKPVVQLEKQFIEHVITGTVSDENGNTLQGATVKLKGSNNVTVTDVNGAFKLTIPEQADGVLQVSFVGFEMIELPVANRKEFSFVLKKATSTLNEVVVTGYSTQKKKDLTGAVAVVNIGDLISQPSGQVTSQLQGQASGVTVLGSGQPGSEPSVQIRGVNTFGDNTPLYVVDGVPTQSISDLNSNDIASMQVLKDAGAASIYGSRASNGVIIITTKKGNGKVKIQYNTYYGMQYPKGGNVWNILTSQEMAQLKFKCFGKFRNTCNRRIP